MKPWTKISSSEHTRAVDDGRLLMELDPVKGQWDTFFIPKMDADDRQVIDENYTIENEDCLMQAQNRADEWEAKRPKGLLVKRTIETTFECIIFNDKQYDLNFIETDGEYQLWDANGYIGRASCIDEAMYYVSKRDADPKFESNT